MGRMTKIINKIFKRPNTSEPRKNRVVLDSSLQKPTEVFRRRCAEVKRYPIKTSDVSVYMNPRIVRTRNKGTTSEGRQNNGEYR